MAEIAGKLDLARGMEVLLKSMRSLGQGTYVLIRDPLEGGYCVYKDPLPLDVVKELVECPWKLRLRMNLEEFTELMKEAAQMAWKDN